MSSIRSYVFYLMTAFLFFFIPANSQQASGWLKEFKKSMNHDALYIKGANIYYDWFDLSILREQNHSEYYGYSYGAGNEFLLSSRNLNPKVYASVFYYFASVAAHLTVYDPMGHPTLAFRPEIGLAAGEIFSIRFGWGFPLVGGPKDKDFRREFKKGWAISLGIPIYDLKRKQSILEDLDLL